jgi:hypothetical protein
MRWAAIRTEQIKLTSGRELALDLRGATEEPEYGQQRIRYW